MTADVTMTARPTDAPSTGRFSGQVAVVTGGASGIGEAIVRRIVADGAKVVVGDRDEHRLELLQTELGDRIFTQACDVRVESDVACLVSAAVERYGPLTLGFNVAGLARSAPFEELAIEHWDVTVDICLKGVFLATKHEGRQMITQGQGGAIVNVASIMATAPSRGSAAYSAAKAGVVMMTRCAAMEWGEHGIRVNSVSPGITYTPAVAALLDDPDSAAPFIARIPMGRVGAASEVAAAVSFLAGSEAAYVSGTNLVIDGAFSTTGYPYARSYDTSNPSSIEKRLEAHVRQS
jgi:NAD(P)-dependent dehydrogenase (short-subunit alcohol dehydrogenase family)